MTPFIVPAAGFQLMPKCCRLGRKEVIDRIIDRRVVGKLLISDAKVANLFSSPCGSPYGLSVPM